ncbi:phage protein [Aeromonas enteropelogenes]|uniref:phage protein n=1 Tax=Aeromonas enteropelogenes TaxID=29489 RepID=UPI003BA3B0F0
MTAKRFSGMNVDITLLGVDVQAETATLSITDNTAVAQSRGVPDGFVDGDVSAEVEFELASKYLLLLLDAVRTAGSFRAVEPEDVLFYANTGGEELKIEAFGVKLAVSDLLNADGKGGSVMTHKIKGQVTAPEFVRINGIPYLSDEDTRHLLG